MLSTTIHVALAPKIQNQPTATRSCGRVDENGIVSRSSPADQKFSLATGKVIPLLTLCTKDLYSQIDERDTKIQLLEERLARLESVIANLEL